MSSYFVFVVYHRSYISDGLFGLLLCISALLHSIVHLIRQHGQITLQLLLLVDKSSVLKQNSPF